MDYSFLDRPEYAQYPLFNMKQVYLAKYKSDKEKRIHRHTGMQINYINEGKAIHFINGQELEYVRGDISIILPYIPHRIIPSGDAIDTWITEFEFVPDFIEQDFSKSDKEFFDFAFLEPFISYENRIKQVISLTGTTQKIVESLLEDAVIEFQTKQAGYVPMVKACLLKLLTIMGREYAKLRENTEEQSIYIKHKNAINEAIQFIQDHYHEEISADDAAKSVAFSTSYFSYLFRLATKDNFTEYLISLRLGKAMAFLKDTDDLVLSISQQVGFNNVSYFNRLFKEKTGLSPSQYRNRFKKG